jgi:hypothetical protein
MWPIYPGCKEVQLIPFPVCEQLTVAAGPISILRSIKNSDPSVRKALAAASAASAVTVANAYSSWDAAAVNVQLLDYTMAVKRQLKSGATPKPRSNPAQAAADCTGLVQWDGNRTYKCGFDLGGSFDAQDVGLATTLAREVVYNTSSWLVFNVSDSGG